MALSADGYIAGPNDETPWSDEEWAAFQDFVRSCDVCLLGRKTYEIMKGGDGFVSDTRYVVITSDAQYKADYPTATIRSAADLPAGDKIGVIGGGELNG